MKEQTTTDKIEERLTRLWSFAKEFPQRHPFLALMLLSIIAIVVAIVWSNSPQKDSSVQRDPIAQQSESPPAQEDTSLGNQVEDFNELQTVPGSEESYREKQAYEEYSRAVEAEHGSAAEDEHRHFDGSKEHIAEGEKFLRSLGGMYSLPYRGGSIQAKYVKVIDSPVGTRYLISIGYLHSKSQAEEEWKKYLRSKGDSGDYYITQYFRMPH